jgi:hypothetical protein
VLGALIAVVAVGALVGVVVIPGGSSRPKSPEAVTDAYYAALGKADAAKAYGLLCAQQQTGAAAYASEVAQDQQTGTGIKSWMRSGSAQVQGNAAIVPGSLTLDDGTSTPIQILLVKANGAWGVCTSDLGGILPGPGTSAGSGSGSGSGGTST